MYLNDGWYQSVISLKFQVKAFIINCGFITLDVITSSFVLWFTVILHFVLLIFIFCSDEITISVNKVNKILKIFCSTRIRITVRFLGWFLVRITILSDNSC